jgi:hypothetical protein
VGVAIFHHHPKGGKRRESTQVYRDDREMWQAITDWIPARERAVLWTHNLGYDVRISRALSALPGLGWRLVGHNLTPGGTWLAWRRGDQSLVMVDSVSVFETTIAQLSKSFGGARPALPSDMDTMDRWISRCLRDVQILRDAVLAYLDRLESLDLGNWQMTGTGQSWAAFRHQHLTHDMLVHWDDDARAAERRAMWTGRCEAYWHGRVRGVRVDEWDMTLAYPRIALTHHVPVALASMFGPGVNLPAQLDRPGYAVLAEVDVTTTEPLVPCERDGRIAWPVGTFRTTLWSPELRLLVDRGQRVAVVKGWLYKAEPALASWARWIVAQLGAPDDVSPAWWKAIMKHWARALIGRWAMTYRDWEHIGQMPYPDIRRATYVDLETGQTGETVQVGRDLFLATETVEWPHSMPQITGYVMSACREILARLLLAAGPRAALYADTDSMLVPADHHDRMLAIARRFPAAGLRLKRSWKGVEIRGPRQIVTGPVVRVAGIPTKAQRLADGSLVGEVWESLAAAISHRRAATVRVTPRRWTLRATDTRRVEGEDGWTVPHTVAEMVTPGMSIR